LPSSRLFPWKFGVHPFVFDTVIPLLKPFQVSFLQKRHNYREKSNLHNKWHQRKD